jgi:hypothetical protein
LERDLIRERTLDGLRAAQAQGRRGGGPAVDEDVLAVTRARHSRGESVTAFARRLRIGRSTRCRALQSREMDPAPGGSACSSVKNSTGTRRTVAVPHPQPRIFPRTSARHRITALADHDQS